MVDRPRASSITGTLQRAAIACQSCRQRKVKCDAQTAPLNEGCGPCRRAGQECLLDPFSDGRRSVNRKFVDKLEQRIEMLEALSHPTGDRRPERPDEDQTNSSDIAPSANPTSAVPSRMGDSTAHDLSKTSDHSYQNLPPSASINQGSSGDTRDVSPSFYGATSHPHVVSSTAESHLTSSDEIDAVGIDLDSASSHLRDHLFQSFFKYQTLWVDVVDKELFLTHQANGNESRWYSKFLENTMLACGTRLSTSKSVRGLGSKYSQWAKDAVSSAISEPTPANLQGFLLLSEYEVTQGNDRQGWMFCGVACRMLCDLGLHERSAIIRAPDEVQELRNEGVLAYALLSACIAYEGVWTLYLGRPSSIPTSVMIIAASRYREKRKTDSPWLNAWVGLCVPMAEINHVLNEQNISDPDRSSALRKLLKQVEEWYKSLPPELSYNESRLTSMDLAGYGLHTQYCKLQILLRRALARPTNTKKRRHSLTLSDGGAQTSSDASSIMAYKHALRIARLVVTYREVFGMEKIPSIMLDNAVVAATAMIEHLNTAGGVHEVQHEVIWLRQLVKSMESVQPHFPIIGRMIDSLRQIRGSGPLFGIVPCVPRTSIEGHIQQFPVQNQSLDPFPTASNTQDSSLGVESNPDTIWDSFDTGIAPEIFTSGGFDDFLLDYPPSKAISGW